MNWQQIDSDRPLRWRELSGDTREVLSGKLIGLWAAADDEEAFDKFTVDKQQALLLFTQRLITKNVWQTVKRINNVYGIGGVGMNFEAWPYLESTLDRNPDFTRMFAKRRKTSGGFYEKGRGKGVLHFFYKDGTSRRWHVHFDLYSPVYSLGTAMKHLRHEYFGTLRPDWQMIAETM